MKSEAFKPDGDDYDVIYEYVDDIYDYPLSNMGMLLSEKSLEDGQRKAEEMFVSKSSLSIRLIMNKLQRKTQ